MNIIYLRTSTEEQNPKNQLGDCKILAEKLNIKEYKIITDKQSAWKEHQERKGFDEVKLLVKKKKLSRLLVWDLDRIYRNRRSLIDFFKLCEVNNCKIYSFRQDWLENINNMPPPWNEIIHELMLQVMGWLAQDESDKKSMRIKASIRKKGNKSYSYKGNKWGRKPLTRVESRIIDLYKSGKTMRDITKEIHYWDRNNNKRFVSLGFVHKTLSKLKEEFK